jgi:hypothetical protein
MTAVLDGPPQTGHQRIRYRERQCPECLTAFAPVVGHQLFCSTLHRRAWNNRATVRGAVLAPLAIVARLTRAGTRGDRETGKRAASDMALLIQRYRDEDRRANDGRGRMDQVQYLRARYAAGFDPL